MKTTTISAMLLLSGFATIAQNKTDQVYAKATNQMKTFSNTTLTSPEVVKKFYTANHEEQNSIEGAKFIKIVKKSPNNLWTVNEFYADGFLAMEGTFTDANEEIKHGNFKHFQPKGILDYEGVL